MTIRKLKKADLESLVRFACDKERENIFLIESLRQSDEAFLENLYWGAFEEETLIAVATYFGRFQSLVVHADAPGTIRKLVDLFVEEGRPLSDIPDFKKYASHAIEQLKIHGISPRLVREETWYEVSKETFRHIPSSRASVATQSDIDALIRLGRHLDGKEIDAPITQTERNIIKPEYILALRDEDGGIMSRAGIHGYSEHYAMIGGVATLPAYRGRGLAKETVSAVCKHWLQRDKSIVLFCGNENESAKHVYTSLGFRPLEGFLLASY